MSFREKSAWISFVLIALAFGIYFARVVQILISGRGRGTTFHLLLALVVALIVLEIVLHIAIAIQSPQDARTPKDERETLIAMKARNVAFPVLLAGAFAAIGTIHLDAGIWGLSHAVLLAVVVAELVRFGAEIVYHRRGV
jgi:archaellum biogenesis protein FlaJ (TadC family)